jgi:hypothetical protein
LGDKSWVVVIGPRRIGPIFSRPVQDVKQKKKREKYKRDRNKKKVEFACFDE